MNNINSFVKEKEYLICIDSDGSAMDTMTTKHEKCFGPAAVEVWNLDNIEDIFLKRWNEINLYSKTRGINRFEGVVETFNDLKAEGLEMPEIENLKEWVRTTSELSNDSLKREIEKKKENEDLKSALKWSQLVNRKIAEEKESISGIFNGVESALAKIYDSADLAVVSSANYDALVEEWNNYNLSNYIEIILAQESGSKAANIAGLKSKGYSSDKVLMIGDALGDLKSAKENNVLFYPILPGQEDKAWQRFVEESSDLFLAGSYQGEYEEKLISEFENILN